MAQHVASEHYLIIAQGISSVAAAEIDKVVRDPKATYAWWNHLEKVWMVCVAPGQFRVWAEWISGIVKAENGRCIILQLDSVSKASGFLEGDAWNWLQQHLRVSV